MKMLLMKVFFLSLLFLFIKIKNSLINKELIINDLRTDLLYLKNKKQKLHLNYLSYNQASVIVT